MATTTTTTNKPLNPRAQDLSPKGYNRAALFSGKALDFDGVNDQITITNGLNAIAGNRITITAWVRLDAETNYYPSIIANKVNGADGFCLLLTPDEKIFFQYDGTGQQIEDGGTIEVGRTYFLTATYDGTNLKTYINGTLTATSATATGKAVAAAGDLTIYVGTQDTGVGYWNGLIAGVRVLNVALTPAQVADLYLNPEKITPDGVATSALKLWLPMMEGAGASAYDGSGNGNDGTINGATWTAGVGAPVAQTALVSWNKGVNILPYSEDFSNVGYSKSSVSVVSNSTTAPNGTTTADTLTFTQSNSYIYYPTAGTGSASGVISVWLKANANTQVYLTTNDLVSFGTGVKLLCNVTTEWQLFSISGTGSNTSAFKSFLIGTIDPDTGGGLLSPTSVYAWGGSIRPTSAGDAYIKTNATAQTSAVLVPEGLTAGASIFGTDIITPRNAFALNLDGASWAQVGDNASLDYATSVTLEAWVYWTAIADKGILGRWYGPDAQRSLMLYANTSTKVSAFYSSSGSATAGTLSSTQNLSANNWYHVVFTANGTTNTLYINGVSDNTAAYSSGFYVSNKNVEIGTYQNDASKAYGAGLANPRIYNRALTAAEVLRNYNADKAKFGL